MEETMIWDGLACPPKDDYAFDFSDVRGRNLDPDVFFHEQFEKKKATKQTIIKKYGKGKELKSMAIVLKKDIDPVAYSRALALEKVELDKEEAAICNNAAADEKVSRPEIVISDHRQGCVARKVLTQQEEKDHALKLDAAKRKLCESYEQINNYKKQRSIQIIEFQNLPPMSKPITQKQKPKAKPKSLAVRNTWSSRLVKV